MNLPASKRRRGRPLGGRSLQRSRLLDAAWELLADQPAGDLSLRQVAAQADVTPALAHYYFGNRDGLLDALLADRIADRIDDLVGAARIRAGQPQLALTFLMQRLSSLLASDPALRACLWLQVPRARKLRDGLRACLRELLTRAQNMAALRTDLPVDYLAESLLGLVMIPYLDGAPGSRADAVEVPQLMLHHLALLRDGVLGNRDARNPPGAAPDS